MFTWITSWRSEKSREFDFKKVSIACLATFVIVTIHSRGVYKPMGRTTPCDNSSPTPVWGRWRLSTFGRARLIGPWEDRCSLIQS